LKPIEAPLLPVSATQQAQLQALLEKYKANQITPEEYHNQRAEILAQP
jgi:translation initiation factor 2 gamma subunit (eIF-2gamma)